MAKKDSKTSLKLSVGLKNLFYSREGYKKKYKLFGLPIMTKDRIDGKKVSNILGVKISKRFAPKNQRELDIIRNSELFDAEWYYRYYKNSLPHDMSLEQHYFEAGKKGFVNPGPLFNSKEYLMISPDVKEHGMNPLIHYENWGWKEKRNISFADMRKVVFPEGTISIEKDLFSRVSFEKRKVTVLASYQGNGIIADHVLYLLKGLKEISDYVVFVSDNPIFEEEIEKIKPYCNHCIFSRHEEYDFGSYKRGYQYLIENNILQKDDDLIFVNDSCYGPVYPFSEVIEDYNKKDCDFFGLTVSTTPKKHLQSFFYIFKSQVYKSAEFKDFMGIIKKQISPPNVVYKYEMQFTERLYNAGFKYSSYVPVENFLNKIKRKEVIPTKWTLTLLKKFRYPFVKVKVLQGSSVESPEKILEYVKYENNELYNLIKPDIEKRLASIKRRDRKVISKYTLVKNYKEKEQQIREKVARGEKIKVVFLANMLSMFPAESLMQKMLKDDIFDVNLYVIPDVRFGDDQMVRLLEETYNGLKEKYDFVEKAIRYDDENQVTWVENVISGADVVCYPSPYDVSFSLYNPYYAIQQGILSFHINYGFFRSKYDRYIYQTDNYNNFWKVFLETESNFEEYKKYGQCDGVNAVITGYSKMDNLVSLFENRKENERKKLIIAPHHSVDGGANRVLALSNFERLSNLFLELPKKYPQIDFVFRPHPVLFTILSKKNHWGEDRVKVYLDELLSNKNVIYSTEGNYLDVFAQSDGIIQDCGSFLVEYFYTKQPQCYILKNKKDIEDKFSDLGKKCLENCYVSYTEKDIIKFIEDIILAGNDPKKEARIAFAENEIMINYPNVNDKIVEEIKKELAGVK